MNINGVDSNSVFQNITTNDIFDFGQSVDIKLSEDTIDLIGTNILVNGGPLQPGGGGIVVNPLNADLNIGNVYDIIDNAGLSMRGINTNQISQAGEITGLLIKTQNLHSLDVDYSDFTGNLNISTKLLVPEISDELGSSSIVLNTGGVNITSDTLNFNSNSVLSATGLNTQYFMGDGSLLQFSANSGNSNFYLYKSHINTPIPPPAEGFIYYNNSNQSLVTTIYISHLTTDVIDIEVFLNNLSQLNDVYIQDKNSSINFIRYNITSNPTIIPNSHISIPVSVFSSGGNGSTSFGINHDILLSFFTNSLETDTRISNIETKTQNQTAILNTTTFSGAGGIISDKFVKTSGLTTQFLKGNGDIDSNTYAQGIASQINSSMPYINALGQVSSNISNLYVQQGNNTIASAILAVQTGVGYSIQLSANSFTETLTFNKQNYIVAGTDSPLFAPTTQIVGNTLIGSLIVGAISTRIKIKDIKFTGNLEFISSIYNELRTYISNCEITGTLIFPAVSGGGTTWIYFFDCSINGAITIPNQSTYGIIFTRCNFAGQTITNSLTVGNTANLIYRECSGFLSLNLGNCIQYGMNTTYLGVSKSSAGSFVKDLGTSSMFLKGDGSVDNIAYSYRKFSKIGVYAIVPLIIGNTDLIPTVNGSVLFASNEAKVGDVYTLTMRGVYVVSLIGQVIRITVSGFNNQFGIGGTVPFPSNVAGTFYFTMTAHYTFLTTTSATQIIELFAGGGSNSTTTLVNSGYAANGNGNCNITNSSTFTITAASSVANGNSIGISCAYLNKY
jgi:hypothetical protein